MITATAAPTISPLTIGEARLSPVSMGPARLARLSLELSVSRYLSGMMFLPRLEEERLAAT
jgi:hypothetical protein